MSLPKNSPRAHRHSIAGRLAGQFAKRLAQGVTIDRRENPVGKKNVKLTQAPKALAKPGDDDPPSAEWWANEQADRQYRTQHGE